MTEAITAAWIWCLLNPWHVLEWFLVSIVVTPIIGYLIFGSNRR